jgi:hypothetical protein
MSASFSVIAERFRRSGHFDRAVALCREGLAAFPDHLSARVTLGCSLLELGQFVEAQRELQSVIKRAPDNLLAIRGLAELHARGIDGLDASDMDAAMADDAQAAIDAEMASAHDAETARLFAAELSAPAAAQVPSSAFAEPSPLRPVMSALTETVPVPVQVAEAPQRATSERVSRSVAEIPAPAEAAGAAAPMVPPAYASTDKLPHVGSEQFDSSEPLQIDAADPLWATMESLLSGTPVEAVADVPNLMSAEVPPSLDAPMLAAIAEPLVEAQLAAARPADVVVSVVPVVPLVPLDEFDPVVEVPEAFAAPAFAVVESLPVDDFDPIIEPLIIAETPALAVAEGAGDTHSSLKLDQLKQFGSPLAFVAPDALPLDEFDPVVATPPAVVAPFAASVESAVSLDEFDPVVATPPAVVAPFAASVESVASFDKFDPVVAAPPAAVAPFAVSAQSVESLDELDPVVEVAIVESVPAIAAMPTMFAIEDVLDQAEEPPASNVAHAVELSAGPDVGPEDPPSPITVMDDWLTRIQIRREAVDQQNAAGATTGSSEGPITVLDDWLTKIQTRRSKLLSEYAAG